VKGFGKQNPEKLQLTSAEVRGWRGWRNPAKVREGVASKSARVGGEEILIGAQWMRPQSNGGTEGLAAMANWPLCRWVEVTGFEEGGGVAFISLTVDCKD